MKSLLIIFLIFLYLPSSAQKRAKYLRLDVNKNFAGTWEYGNGQDSLKMVLEIKKKVFFKGPNVYVNCLQVQYDYVQIGKTISHINRNNTDMQIDWGLPEKDNPAIINAFFSGDDNFRSGTLKIQLLENDIIKSTFVMNERIYIKGISHGKDIVIPENMVFKRLK